MTLRLLLVDDSTYFLRAARYAPRAGGGGRRGRGLDQRRGDRAAPARCGRTSRSSTSTSARRAASTAPGDSQRTPAPARDGWCSSPPIPKPTSASSSTPARPSGSCRSRSSRAKPFASCSARETGASSAASRYVTTAGRAVVVGRHRSRERTQAGKSSTPQDVIVAKRARTRGGRPHGMACASAGPDGRRERPARADRRRRLRRPALRRRRPADVRRRARDSRGGAAHREPAGAPRGGPGDGPARLHHHRAGAVPRAVERGQGRSPEQSRTLEQLVADNPVQRAGPGASPRRRCPTSTTTRCRCSTPRGATRRRADRAATEEGKRRVDAMRAEFDDSDSNRADLSLGRQEPPTRSPAGLSSQPQPASLDRSCSSWCSRAT